MENNFENQWQQDTAVEDDQYPQQQDYIVEGRQQPRRKIDQRPQQCNRPAISTTAYLIWSIVETLCCNPVTGVIGLVLTMKADSALKTGDIEEANRDLKNTKVALIVGAAAVVGLLIVYILGLVLIALASA